MYPSRVNKFKIFAQFLMFFGLLLTVFVGAWQIDKVREFFGQASGEPANIMVDTKGVLGVMDRPWRNLAQGGEDHAWRLKPLVPQVKALKPEYIRIDHLYDFYDIVVGTEGNISYDFSKLDPLLDDILATGAKPYIALTYMPTQFSKSDIVDAPKNYADWQVLTQKTIEHISGKRGIENVYYEVWNEPDLFGGWKYYGEKNYLDLYRASSRGAKNAQGVKQFKLGGPAITAFYKNWIVALCNAAIKENLRLDFISWHRYNLNIEQYQKDMFEIREIMEQYPQLEVTMEYHITEWGHDSNNHPGYDTNFSAAHTVAGSIEMVGVVERAFAFEIQDGKSPEGKEKWGRWGMFTHKDFGAQAKPRYFGLKMLDRISDQRLQLLGKGSWVKALAAKNIKDNTVEVVLANYDSRGANSENVPITFDNVEAGKYLITKELSNGQNTKENIATTEAKLRTNLFMPTNSVGFVTLKKVE